MRRGRRQIVRWSAHSFAAELGVTYNKVMHGLKAQGIMPGPDEKYSTKDVFQAVSSDPLKAEAERMRWEGVIAEAELKKMRVAEAKGELIPAQLVFKTFHDAYVTYVQRVKHFTTLSKAEKEDLINAISPINQKTPTTGISPSHNGA